LEQRVAGILGGKGYKRKKQSHGGTHGDGLTFQIEVFQLFTEWTRLGPYKPPACWKEGGEDKAFR